MNDTERNEWLQLHKEELVNTFNLDSSSEFWDYDLVIYDSFEEANSDAAFVGSTALLFAPIIQIDDKWVRIDK